MDENSDIRILVLDDEPLMLKLHARVLADLGYTSVTTHESGHRALAEMDQAGGDPDLILLDLRMPEMDGVEFIRRLAARNFEGRLILVSGEGERVLASVAKLALARQVRVLGQMKKPVSPQELEVLINLWRPASGTGRVDWKRTYTPDEVKDAIRNGQLTLYYQPKVLIKTGELVGVEALSRWPHPRDGLVLPEQFIGVAEANGLIYDLTCSSFELAVQQAGRWRESGLALHMSVNLSVDALSDLKFADFAARQAARAKVPTHDIITEVTESRLIHDLRDPLDVLIRLHLMRFKLSIDDFGTGYSSLAQLRDIPFSELKIDRSFVHRVAVDPTVRTMYNTCLGLSKQLGMISVAEGVEEQRDWDYVRGTDCDIAQGYFIARPMPPDALPAWKASWEERRKKEFGA